MEITAEQKLNIAKVAKKFKLKLILIFGSFARGRQRKDSDLDIAVFGSKGISFNEEIKIIGELSSIFRKNVDLSVLNTANPLLTFQASKNSILLYGSKEDFLKFKMYAFSRYNDYFPYFAMERSLNKKIINSYAC
jgi:predicted nucleotidyltransferase